MRLTLFMATLMLVAATLLPFWRHPHWMVRGLEFPRMQFAVLAALLLFAQGTLLDHGAGSTWILAAVTLLCLAWQLWWILPYTPLWPVQVQAAGESRPERHIRFVTANVLTSNRNAGTLIDLVRQYQPDVLVTLESDQWWQDQLDTLQSEMPYSIKYPLDNLYGMHVYSRLPLEESRVEFLVQDDVPSMHALVRLRTGEGVRVHFLHPAPPSPSENLESAERDAELVIVARSVVRSDQPVVVTGDLNDVAWSTTTRLFLGLSELLDPRVGRGMFNTFHARYPMFRWPMDHLFHSRHFTLKSIRRMPRFGSDHFALFTELAFTPARGAGQDSSAADQDERFWAQSITDDQDVHGGDVPRPGE